MKKQVIGYTYNNNGKFGIFQIMSSDKRKIVAYKRSLIDRAKVNTVKQKSHKAHWLKRIATLESEICAIEA